jgi:quercetin dioxygenase-like cupin family protein
MTLPQSQAKPVSDLPNPSFYLTGHDSSGTAIIQEKRTPNWTVYNDNQMAFNMVYTTSDFPVSMNDDVDVKRHDDLVASNKLGLVNQNGSVCRIVDIGPGFQCVMHRTQSLDYGVVLEGTVELIMESGQVQVMKRSDVAVQRGTMHAWRNASATEWVRMMFVLQDARAMTVRGKSLKEDLGGGIEGLPKSGNDEQENTVTGVA